jgi:hypothetical protein
MALKFKNGTEVKENDKVVGFDHCNRPCAGVAIKGIPSQGQEEYVFKNDAHGAVQPSLSLTNFLRLDEKDWKASATQANAAQPATAATPPLSTAK